MNPEKLGKESLANSTTYLHQFDPVTTVLSDGGYVIAWHYKIVSAVVDPIISLQIFNSDGTLRVPEIQQYWSGSSSNPSIAPLSNGGFVVAYDLTRFIFSHSSDFAVYDANDNLAGPHGTVGYPITTEMTAVTSLGTGFAIAYHDIPYAIKGGQLPSPNENEIVVQRFDLGGNALGGPIVANTISGDLADPDIAELANGRFAVIWEHHNGAISIRARVFESDGSPVAAEFEVASTSTTFGSPKITALTGGGFAIIYSDASVAPPEDSLGVRVYVYDVDGSPVSAEIIANSNFNGDQAVPDIAALPNGGFVAVWVDFDGSAGSIKGQEFDANGTKVGTEFIVSTQGVTSSVFSDSAVSVSAFDDGRFIVTWWDLESVEDDWGSGIFSQMMDTRDGIRGTDGNDVLAGLDNADIISGRDGDDSLYGNGNDDQIFGEGGDHLLVGQEGNDALFGMDGDDILVGGPGDDELWGGNGSDTAYYFYENGPLDINLFAGTATGVAGSDTLFCIENTVGSSGNDLIGGSNNDDILHGSAGSDGIYGNNGDDTLLGGTGNDLLHGGEGFDTASYVEATGPVNVNLYAGLSSGGAGFDTLIDIERVLGSSGDDVIAGDSDNNVLEGGAGSDSLYSNGGYDKLFGGSGDDLLVSQGWNEELTGQEGDDIFVLTPGTLSFSIIRIMDFQDGGAGTGDMTGISGFGGSVSMVQVSSSSYEIRSSDNTALQQFHLIGHSGAALVEGDDFFFI